MLKLPNTYKSPAGYVMKCVKRTDQVAMYKEELMDYFEVFEVKQKKARRAVINGKVVDFKNKEALPHNEAFGDYAYAPNSRKRADYLYDMLINRIAER